MLAASQQQNQGLEGVSTLPLFHTSPSGGSMVLRSPLCISRRTTLSESEQHGIHSTPWSIIHSPGSSSYHGDHPINIKGAVSEPRNYAPATARRSIMAQPPPRFDLSSIPHTPPQTGCEVYYNSEHGAPQHNAVVQANQALTNNVSQYLWRIGISRSGMLAALTSTPSGLPTLETALSPQFYPFVEGGKLARPINNGVVKLRNIPFATQRSEVIAFLGRNSKILNDIHEPVHIIMERITSKTMDAYVEFQTLEDAMKAVERHHTTMVSNGKAARLGDRPISVELSGQASLMKDLFPHTVGVVWDGVRPEFKPFNEEDPWENFRGFVSEEEMIMLVKHVEVPHRSPYSRECPQRPYECLISTIKKLPWAHTDRITMSQRRSIYKATCELLRLLHGSIVRNQDVVNLNQKLYQRIVTAAMHCPGFTTLMKDDVAFIAKLSQAELLNHGQPYCADSWRHQYALAPKPGVPLDVVEWYIAVIREQSTRDIVTCSMQERNIIQEHALDTDQHWGLFWHEARYIEARGRAFDEMKLSECARIEFAAVERILHRALLR